MKSKGLVQQILQKYTYKKDKPIHQFNNYSVYKAVQTQTNLNVTIKLLNNYNPQLIKYLKKIKDTKHQNVIKVYQVVADAGKLLLITQEVSYGTLKNGLKYCQRLDDSDSIFIIKNLLMGHIQLLRSDCNWFGTQDDIQFTETGPKLSWNNSCNYNLVNPFPTMIQKIYNRPDDPVGQTNLLPFPKSKTITDLAKVSKENASQMSLHPHLKKKQKLAKKKGKGWIALKQYKNKNQYFDEITYFAVSEQLGFIKVKMYDSGHIQPAQLNLNKNKATFTKILDVYDEGNKTFIISSYSNDGNLQAYVTKLKTAGVSLKQDHIQFFFYSLFEPLKQVQQSSLKSLNMLHIKNIYIENGIPKIGQPVPMNQNLSAILMDRQQVPDFYHPLFKKNPSGRDQTFDTYSLGVLLYKLMYTEYPIFPEHKVHIPTTPNYNKRLKSTLQIFLNEGGTLKDIQARIQVSQTVVNQVKQNKQKLIIAKKQQQQKMLQGKRGKKKNKKGNNSLIPFDQDAKSQNSIASHQSQSKRTHQDEQNQSDDQNDQGCCGTLCAKLSMSKAQKEKNIDPMIIGLQQSPYKLYRICSKIIVLLIFYIFVFYFFFISNTVTLFSKVNLLHQFNVTIATKNYTITATDKTVFQTKFNTTNKTIQALTTQLGCFVDSYNGNPVYSTTIYDSSGQWIGYLIGALVGLLAILIIKIFQIYNFDLIKVRYYKSMGIANFNILNYIFFMLFWFNFMYLHYYVFNFVFHQQTQPCFGSKKPYHSLSSFFQNMNTFMNAYVVAIVLAFALSVVFVLALIFTKKIPYNKLLNPVLIVGPLLAVSYVICRIGVVNNYFFPNALNDTNNIILNYFIGKPGDFVGVLGTIPQLLWIGEIILVFIIDFAFWGLIDKKRKMLIAANDEPSQADLNDQL